MRKLFQILCFVLVTSFGVAITGCGNASVTEVTAVQAVVTGMMISHRSLPAWKNNQQFLISRFFRYP